MPRWKGQNRGTPLGHRIFLFTLKRFGLGPSYFLLRFVTLYFFLFSKGSNRSAYFYFRHVQGFGPLRAIRSIYRNYVQFGQTLLDKYALLSGAAQDAFSYEHENEKHLQQLIREGKGAILLSAHIGNWDMAGHLLERLQGRINVVMYENEKERIKEVLGPLLQKRSFNIIGVGSGTEHLIEIREALANGELVCMHGDRYMEGVKTIETELMGKRTRLPMGPFILASRLKAPVCFVFACKDSSRHYHFYSSPPHFYDVERGTPQEESARKVVDDYIPYLASFMKRYPTQWFNFFPFWEEEKGSMETEEESTATQTQ